MKFVKLNDDDKAAFETFKSKLMELTVFVLPPREGEYKIYNDANDKKVGCVLLQSHPKGPSRTIGYW